MKIWECL